MQSYSELLRQRRRISWLNLGLVGVGVVLVGRLFSLQIVNHQRYRVLATREHNRKYEIPASRGQIYLKDGDDRSPLALNQNLKLLYGDPKQVTDPVKAAKALVALTGDSVDDYTKALSSPGEYVVLKQKVTTELASKITALHLDGIGLSDQQYRTYPEGQLASQVVGFVNQDGKGQYGIEGFLDKDLAGTPGRLSAKTDIAGNPIATADNIVDQPVNGKSFILTLDRNIQAQSEKFLKDGVQAVGAKSGSVIVMDPKTGAIKAMANWPTYDANDFGSVKDYSLFSNSVVSDQFEPGSGFKVITMSTGLDTGKVKPDTTYDDSGEFKQDGYVIHNAENHKFGIQTMTDVITKSLNTGVIFVLKSLGGDPNAINLTGKKTLYDYITKHFGFGVATGVEQEGEASGNVVAPNKGANGNNVNYANMTFGQGISVTMIQMANAVSAIANGGKLYQPYLVDTTIEADGTEHKTDPRVINPRVISPEAAKQMTDMMITVVQHGSGWAAKMKGYDVAGKTGTAQIPRADGQGYEDGKNIGSFVGFAPVQDPRFVIMVRINEPKVSGFAETTTVPVFAHIADWMMKYYAVPPNS